MLAHVCIVGTHGGTSVLRTGLTARRSRCTPLAASKRRNAGRTMRDQLTEVLELDKPDDDSDALKATAKERRVKRGRSGHSKDESQQGVVEDVELFNIDTGWSDAAFEGGFASEDAQLLTKLGTQYSSLDEQQSTDYDEDLSDDPFDDDEQTEWTTDNYDSSVFGEVNTGSKGGRTSSQTGTQGWVDDDDDDDDLAGWTVSSVPEGYEVQKPAQASASMQKTQTSEMGSKVRNLLDSMPHDMSKRLRLAEAEREQEDAATNPRALAKAAARKKTHRRLRIISGDFGGKRLLSPQGDVVRPMMEMVKAAVFSMIQSRLGGSPIMPENSKWLDMFAGTGSIGLEAISRGCVSASFIELDPWVTKSCLQPNIAACGVEASANVFTTRAESFMTRAAKTPGFAGGPFDFISVCPPYLLVSYPELFELLEASSLAKPTSIILVEYPKRLAEEIPDTLCGLEKVRDRKYGRTFLALYAPAEEGDNDDEDGTWQSYS